MGPAPLCGPCCVLRTRPPGAQTGGHLSLGTWCPPPSNQFFALLLGAIAGNLTAPPNLPPGPDMFRYADPLHTEHDLGAAGFHDITVHPMAFTVLLVNGAADLIRFLGSGSVRSRAMYAAQPVETRRTIDRHLMQRVEELTTTGQPATIGLTAVVITARA